MGLDDIFYAGYFITSILSFIPTWVATVLLLHHYVGRMGRARYWIVVSIPLVYFLSAFQPFVLTLLTPLRLSDPVSFGIVYTLFFTATKPVGGIMFGIAFWSAAGSITRHAVKDYMKFSAYGMMLLFTSNQIVGVILAHYPPFGLVGISFLGIASYLVLVGIYSSAISFAEDKNLRKSLYRNVEQETAMLKNIGTSQMEIEIQKKVTKITKNLSEEARGIMESTGVEPSLEEDTIREYLKLALEETKRLRTNK
jgi:hypothetical protein